jgi:hypothetical protein
MATYTEIKIDYIEVFDSTTGARYWVSPTAEDFNSIYWATESGGTPGASVPGPLNPVFFDGQGVGNCILDTTVNIYSLKEGADYPGSLIQTYYPVLTGDASFLGGNFIGTDVPVTVHRNLTVSGGFHWLGTDNIIYALGDVYCNAGFFPESNSVLFFMGLNSQGLHSNGGTLPNVYVDKSTSNQIRAYGDYPIYLNGDFYIFDGTFNTHGHDIIVGNSSYPEPVVPTTSAPTTAAPTTPAPTTAAPTTPAPAASYNISIEILDIIWTPTRAATITAALQSWDDSFIADQTITWAQVATFLHTIDGGGIAYAYLSVSSTTPASPGNVITPTAGQVVTFATVTFFSGGGY